MVISDTMDAAGNTLAGQLTMDNVEMWHVGQRQTFKAGLRFDSATTNTHTVTNSVIHEGLGWGLSVTLSKNVNVSNTQVIGFKAVGVSIHSSHDVTMDGIMTADVLPRDFTAIGKLVDKEGCMLVCSYHEPDTGCANVVVKNSLSVGCKFSGFIAPGHGCAEENTNFFNNVARSVEGCGARIYASRTDSDH